MNLTIVPSILEHVRELSKSIRDKDKKEAQALGLDPAKGLFWAYKYSVMRRTAIVGSEVAAMWGICGTPLGNVGVPYLITGTAIDRLSVFKFVREYKKEVQDMQKLFPILENYVDASYDGAIRMLKVAGFTLTGPFEMPPYKKLFLRFTLKEQN